MNFKSDFLAALRGGKDYRALMELVVINVGYDLGVIPANVFTMLVLMAVVSTIITAPALRLWLPKLGWKYQLRSDV